MAQSAAVAIWLDAAEDRQRHCARRPPDAGHELARELPEPLHRGRPERIRDIRPVMLGLHPAGLPKNLQVMRDCRLGDGAAGREVARTHGAFVAQLAKNREPGAVGRCVQQRDIGIRLSCQAITTVTGKVPFRVVRMCHNIDNAEYCSGRREHHIEDCGHP